MDGSEQMDGRMTHDMNESIRGSLIVIILCMMIALLVWGLSSPPTTIGLPAFTYVEPLSLDVDKHL